MLSNAYFLAKFRFDTAENEPAKAKFWKNFANLIFARSRPKEATLRLAHAVARLEDLRGPGGALPKSEAVFAAAAELQAASAAAAAWQK